MTRRSYPRVAHGPIVACPCCKRELEVKAYFDGDVFALDDMNLHAELVPLREQPCRTSERRPVPFWPIDTFTPKTECEPTPAHLRGASCNWLGTACNDASHVTPVSRWTKPAKGVVRGLVVRVTCSRPRRGLARCVQGESV